MRLLICGSRSYLYEANVYDALKTMLERYPALEIIHGGAAGADTHAARFAGFHCLPVHVYPANWNKYGPSAGPIRNQLMLDSGRPDYVFAFIDKPLGKSRGTNDMVKRAQAAGVSVRIFGP